MSNVIHLTPERVPHVIEQLERFTDNRDHEPPTGGGGGPPLETRVVKLENAAQEARDRLVRIEARLEHIDAKISHEMATKDSVKAAISDAKNSIIMWVVSAFFLAQLLPAILKKLGL